jgi:lipid-binding SYLF domain-containing protein
MSGSGMHTLRARNLQSRATAVLVLPDLVKAGFLVGAEGGEGVLFGPDGCVRGRLLE